jgi:hypothetical protein
MRRTSMLAALLLLATSAFAQTSAEYGRYDAGQMDFKFKAPTRFYGSLGASTGGSAMGTYGGTLVKDKAWFFASGQRVESTQTVPQFDAKFLDTRVVANPNDHNSITASATMPQTMTNFKVPAFFSMHYTGIVSPNAFVTASVSTTK